MISLRDDQVAVIRDVRIHPLPRGRICLVFLITFCWYQEVRSDFNGRVYVVYCIVALTHSYVISFVQHFFIDNDGMRYAYCYLLLVSILKPFMPLILYLTNHISTSV